MTIKKYFAYCLRDRKAALFIIHHSIFIIFILDRQTRKRQTVFDRMDFTAIHFILRGPIYLFYYNPHVTDFKQHGTNIDVYINCILCGIGLGIPPSALATDTATLSQTKSLCHFGLNKALYTCVSSLDSNKNIMHTGHIKDSFLI